MVDTISKTNSVYQ